MLNKEICKRCKNKNGWDKGKAWSKDSEKLWSFVGVSCPAGKQCVCEKDNPPAGCEYSLEHAVAVTVNIDKNSGAE